MRMLISALAGALACGAPLSALAAPPRPQDVDWTCGIVAYASASESASAFTVIDAGAGAHDFVLADAAARYPAMAHLVALAAASGQGRRRPSRSWR